MNPTGTYESEADAKRADTIRRCEMIAAAMGCSIELWDWVGDDRFRLALLFDSYCDVREVGAVLIELGQRMRARG